ncbi:MAG: SUMF1/EgtB/PvdO family nonheme iron enzyme, partial [Abditibacteriota bacterium]|nr:SUMF1/EgtB/PvdO family nonheme iron enzyme [Abditibacteriota bacterium]
MRQIRYILILTALLAAAVSSAYATTTGAAKKLANNGMAALTAVCVTYVGDGFFYVQDVDTYGGIKIVKEDAEVALGEKYYIRGRINTDASGERYITPSIMNKMEDTFLVSPIAMSTGAMGGTDFFYNASTGAGQIGVEGGRGANNIGTYIKIYGSVTYADPNGEFIYLYDGADVYDGNTFGEAGAKGVKVFLGAEKAPLERSFYSAYGISTVRMENGKRIRALLNRGVDRQSEWTPIEDMDLVKVTGGVFLMGNSGVGDDERFGYPREYPQHPVYVPDFYIGKTEVTRKQFNEFVSFGGYYRPQYWSADGWKWRMATNRTYPSYRNANQDFGLPSGSFGFTQNDDSPVIGVTYYEAEAYCNWAGGHLPTEAQWEKAARWTGSSSNVYPWGNAFAKGKANDWFDTAVVGWKTRPVAKPAEVKICDTLETAGQVLVDIDAKSYDGGNTWVNRGANAIGNFTKRGNPVLGDVAGVRCVTFNGGDDAYLGPVSPDSICGRGPCSIEVWAFNPSYSDEETILSWAKRGGPEATTRTFNFGNNPNYGAFGHWANDLGWSGNPPTSTWRYLVYTYDGTTAKIYDNGLLKTQKTIALNTYKGYRINLAIQNDANGVPNTHPGTLSIAAARIHTGVLTAAQIENNFFVDAAAMGALSTSPYGCSDMSGNV